MNITEAWAVVKDMTDRTSSIVRQLAFAGIAIIWLFRFTTPGADGVAPSASLPPQTWWPLLLLVVSLALDLLQYVVAAALYYIFTRKAELAQEAPPDFWVPKWINDLPYIALILKTITMSIAYALLIRILVIAILEGKLPTE